MAPNIFGDRFYGFREPAWHSIGKVFYSPIPAVQAVKECGLDYNVVKLPLSGQVETPMGVTLVNVPDRIMIVREPTQDDPEYRYFGVASSDYGLIQNVEVAESLDRLTEAWPVETVGALGMGETMFMTLDAGETEVHGELIRQYFLVTDTKDGGTSMKIAFTPVRAECENTLITGLSQATVSAALQHRSSVGADFDFRVDLVQKLQAARATTMKIFEDMARTAISGEDMRWIVEQTYPTPKKPTKVDLVDGVSDDEILLLGDLYDQASKANETWLYYCSRVDVFRSAAVWLFEKISDEYPGIAGTAWAAYNAVVESADYRNGSDTVPTSTLFGARAQEKRRAFKAATQFIK